MSKEEEFRALNAKILDDSAREDERRRWQELRDELHGSKAPDDENRRHLRGALPITVTFQSEQELVRAVSSDLGAGGLCLPLAEEPPIGSEHRLELTLPGASVATAVNARVAWANGGHVGFQFLEVPDDLRNRIDALVWEEVDLSDL